MEIKPAVPIEWAEQPIDKPLTSGEDVSNTLGQSSNKDFPKDAPMHPVMRMDATANFGSHSGPTALEPSMPSADITDRCNNGKDNGAGTESGDAEPNNAVPPRDIKPETVQVASTHLKSSGLSSHRLVVLYILTPKPVTAAFSHLNKRSPTPTPLLKYGAAGPTKRDARFEVTAQITKGCSTFCTPSGSNLQTARPPMVVLA